MFKVGSATAYPQIVQASTDQIFAYIGGDIHGSDPAEVLVIGDWYDVLVTWAYPGNVNVYVCSAGGSDSTSSKAMGAEDLWNGVVYVGSVQTAAIFNGSLRDVMLLSRVITPEEWTAYKAGTKPTGNVVADWPLYPDWLDDSGNANHLTASAIAPTFEPKAAPTAKPAPTAQPAPTPKAVP